MSRSARMFALVLGLAMFLFGCAFKPNYAAAMDDTFLLPDRIESSQQHVIDEHEERIEASGYRIKRGGSGRPSARPFVVELPEAFDDWPREKQLRTLRHEMVHTRQATAMGWLTMGALYTSEVGRWAIEMQAKRQGIRDMCDQQHDREQMEDHIARAAVAFPKNYRFRRQHHAAVAVATLKVLMDELDRCAQD